MSDILEHVDTTTLTVDTENGEHDRFKHYFRKDAIDANFLCGTPMQAMCGKIVKQQTDPEGKTMCQACQEWWDSKDE